MKLGKVYIREGLNEHEIKALSEYISNFFVILEKVVAQDADGKHFVMMIATCGLFNPCPDNIKQIPEYKFVFFKLATSKDADTLDCRVEPV